jgi:hypothetical protein
MSSTVSDMIFSEVALDGRGSIFGKDKHFYLSRADTFCAILTFSIYFGYLAVSMGFLVTQVRGAAPTLTHFTFYFFINPK